MSGKIYQSRKRRTLHHVLYIVENVDVQTKRLEDLKDQIKEKEQLQLLIKALTDEYSTVAGVDVNTGDVTVYKLANRIADMKMQASKQEFNQVGATYIGTAVHPDDRDDLYNIWDIKYIMARLEKVNHITRVYRNNEGVYGELKIVKANENTFIMGFIEKNSQITEMNKKIYLDSLSKVKNRRFYDEKVLHSATSALVICDIDKFKDINDTYGHTCGDEAITAVASVLSSFVRGSDHVVRYGGDEFILSFPVIPFNTLEMKLESIRQGVEKIALENYPDLHLTMSFGAVHGDGIVEDLFPKADEALYISKKDRNRVTVLRR